jgi:hypothetical protein
MARPGRASRRVPPSQARPPPAAPATETGSSTRSSSSHGHWTAVTVPLPKPASGSRPDVPGLDGRSEAPPATSPSARLPTAIISTGRSPRHQGPDVAPVIGSSRRPPNPTARQLDEGRLRATRSALECRRHGDPIGGTFVLSRGGGTPADSRPHPPDDGVDRVNEISYGPGSSRPVWAASPGGRSSGRTSAGVPSPR